MTEPNGWLDMSRFSDEDPDTVLTDDQHGLLTTALAVDDSGLPDSVWEHMLAAVIGPTDDADDTDLSDESGTEDVDDDDDGDWAADLEHSLGLDGTEDGDGVDGADADHDHAGDHHDHTGGTDVAS